MKSLKSTMNYRELVRVFGNVFTHGVCSDAYANLVNWLCHARAVPEHKYARERGISDEVSILSVRLPAGHQSLPLVTVSCTKTSKVLEDQFLDRFVSFSSYPCTALHAWERRKEDIARAEAEWKVYVDGLLDLLPEEIDHWRNVVFTNFHDRLLPAISRAAERDSPFYTKLYLDEEIRPPGVTTETVRAQCERLKQAWDGKLFIDISKTVDDAYIELWFSMRPIVWPEDDGEE